MRTSFPDARFLACTATAAPEQRAEILKSLRMGQTVSTPVTVIAADVKREELHAEVVVGGSQESLDAILCDVLGRPAYSSGAQRAAVFARLAKHTTAAGMAAAAAQLAEQAALDAQATSALVDTQSAEAMASTEVVEAVGNAAAVARLAAEEAQAAAVEAAALASADPHDPNDVNDDDDDGDGFLLHDRTTPCATAAAETAAARAVVAGAEAVSDRSRAPSPVRPFGRLPRPCPLLQALPRAFREARLCA